MDDLGEFGEGEECDLTSGEWLYCRLKIVDLLCCKAFLEFCRLSGLEGEDCNTLDDVLVLGHRRCSFQL